MHSLPSKSHLQTGNAISNEGKVKCPKQVYAEYVGKNIHTLGSTPLNDIMQINVFLHQLEHLCHMDVGKS